MKTLNGGNAIGLDSWVVSGSLTVKQTLRDLEDAGIACERIDWNPNDDSEWFRVGAGVDLMFWDETQSSSNEDGLPRLAPADMTFNGFSYSRQNDVADRVGTAEKQKARGHEAA